MKVPFTPHEVPHEFWTIQYLQDPLNRYIKRVIIEGSAALLALIRRAITCTQQLSHALQLTALVLTEELDCVVAVEGAGVPGTHVNVSEKQKQRGDVGEVLGKE
jgi:hypothetical protein